MITEIIKLPEKTEEDKKVEKLIEEFNQEAKKQNSRYFIKVKYETPFLKKSFLKFFDDLGIQIYYNNYTDEFSFIGGICKEEFNDIKPILEKIPTKFKIELL